MGTIYVSGRVVTKIVWEVSYHFPLPPVSPLPSLLPPSLSLPFLPSLPSPCPQPSSFLPFIYVCLSIHLYQSSCLFLMVYVLFFIYIYIIFCLFLIDFSLFIETDDDPNNCSKFLNLEGFLVSLFSTK